MLKIHLLLLALILVLVFASCGSTPPRSWLPREGARLTEVATSARQWTGLAIASDGRSFVNFPLWSDAQEFALGELSPDGAVTPYPNDELNDWSPGRFAADHFVCVQALLADDRGRLWVLDPASPRFEGVVPGGPKLVVIDLNTDTVERIYRFDAEAAGPTSYLNDLRLDLARRVAYISDSGSGAIVVLNLDSGQSRRLLTEHASTQSEGLTLQIEGKPWLMGGEAPQVHCDGIALSADASMLYYQALSGRNLYRIPTAALRDASLTPMGLAERVEQVAEVGPSDGLLVGPDGAVYLSSLEENAIRRVWPNDGRIETVVSDPLIAWPDSFARGADGRLYFTTAQIHRGASPPEPYRIFRLDP